MPYKGEAVGRAFAVRPLQGLRFIFLVKNLNRIIGIFTLLSFDVGAKICQKKNLTKDLV